MYIKRNQIIFCLRPALHRVVKTSFIFIYKTETEWAILKLLFTILLLKIGKTPEVTRLSGDLFYFTTLSFKPLLANSAKSLKESAPCKIP